MLELVPPGRALPGDADLVLLPGSKATRADLDSLHREGWALDIQAHVRRGGWVVGICGGYQMLGRRIADPAGVEGPPGETPGLGLLDVETVMGPRKRLVRASGHAQESGEAVAGYEMHMGETSGPDTRRPLLTLARGPDGARSSSGRVMGCYLHGLFAADGFRQGFLGRLRRRESAGVAYDALVEETLDALGAHLEAHLDLDRQLDVCQQCHLNGAVTVMREGRAPFDFRPSESLVSSVALFSTDEGAATSQITVISHADRMKRSACSVIRSVE